MTKPIRAFLAIDLPEEIRDQIRGIQDRLKTKLKGIRWIRPEGIHLTLKFLGSISKNDILNISGMVEKQTKDVGPLMLNVGTAGTFPDLKRPRVLWLGVGGETERLLILQKKMDTSLEDCGFKSEARTFSPHLTLGRIKSHKGISGLSQAIEDGKNFAAGSFHADGLTFFKSDLTPKGAIYTKLAYFPFGGEEYD
jgi:2'-5' RNA ligase